MSPPAAVAIVTLVDVPGSKCQPGDIPGALCVTNSSIVHQPGQHPPRRPPVHLILSHELPERASSI
jgi:hypothetical protein